MFTKTFLSGVKNPTVISIFLEGLFQIGRGQPFCERQKNNEGLRCCQLIADRPSAVRKQSLTFPLERALILYRRKGFTILNYQTDSFKGLRFSSGDRNNQFQKKSTFRIKNITAVKYFYR